MSIYSLTSFCTFHILRKLTMNKPRPNRTDIDESEKLINLINEYDTGPTTGTGSQVVLR